MQGHGADRRRVGKHGNLAGCDCRATVFAIGQPADADLGEIVVRPTAQCQPGFPIMSAASRTVYFLTHPDVLIDPAVPVPQWRLSARGRERMARVFALPWLRDVGAVWCSTERKARDGAEMLAAHLGLPVTELEKLGENDRSATGYLPRAEFEVVADEFFAHPEKSVRGWERAIDAQRRIIGGVETALASPENPASDIVIVAHGGVGALLICHLLGVPITRAYDQPPNNGGNYFAFDAATRGLHHRWKAIDA